MGVTCNLTAYEVGNSMNIPNNTTNVYIKLTATTTGTSHNNYSPSGTIAIDGTPYSYSHNIPKNSTVILYEATHTITHNSDGRKSIGISYSFNTGISAGTLTGSQTLTLSTVPRTSSVTCADGNVGSATTININRASSSFTHTLKYSFGGLAGTIATKTANTSIGWTIPTSFYTQIPNAKSGQGTITCETYSGSTLIGTSTCTFNAVVLETSNKPTITATVVDVNEITKALTGDANKLVKYFSNANVIMTATAKNSATIKSQKVVCGNKSSTSTTSTLNNVESGTFNISCTDSRGFSTSSTITKTIVNYIKLAITSLTIERESSTSNTVKISCKGNYFNASFGSVANTLTLKWRYRSKGGNWSGYTNITAAKSGNTFTYNGTLGTNFDYQQAYEFEVSYADKLISDNKTVPVTAGVSLFDIWKDNLKINGFLEVLKNLIVTGNVNGFKLASACARGVKSLTSKSHSNYGTNNEYVPDMSFIAYWNGRYSSTASNLTYCHEGEIQAKPVKLYENTSGTNGTVTLSESAANFTYLEIFYFDMNNGVLDSTTVWSPNGKAVSLEVTTKGNDTNLRINAKKISIQGTSVSSSDYQIIYVPHDNGSWNNNEIAIQKVVGYR